jgi:hypothetical protein
MDEGVGILNLIPAAGGFELLRIALDLGAKKCTSKALNNHSNAYYPAASGIAADKSQGIDGLLLRMLELLPQPLSKGDIELVSALSLCLKCRHTQTAVRLVEAGIPFNPTVAV